MDVRTLCKAQSAIKLRGSTLFETDFQKSGRGPKGNASSACYWNHVFPPDEVMDGSTLCEMSTRTSGSCYEGH
jgi:hypothetical protein